MGNAETSPTVHPRYPGDFIKDSYGHFPDPESFLTWHMLYLKKGGRESQRSATAMEAAYIALQQKISYVYENLTSANNELRDAIDILQATSSSDEESSVEFSTNGG